MNLELLRAPLLTLVALWLAFNLRGNLQRFGSAIVMGVAVCGMHYTGMYAMSVHESGQFKPIVGMTPLTFLSPIVVFVILVTITLFYALLNRPAADSPIDRIMVPPQPQPPSGVQPPPSAFEPRQTAGNPSQPRRPSTYVRSSR